MDSLKMHTPDLAEENYKKLAALFPNAMTETITGYDENGKPIVERAIDADVLRQEISAQVVEGPQERYQFTWPDKKKSVVLANQPIAKTLRLDRKKSVGRDGTPGSIDTGNIYIEGDNLDALKLLQETYLGKVKMIYIDPPYNTGSDAFVYDDDSSISGEEFSHLSGQRDDDGNLLFDMRTNNETNGRFHTDWLNMMYSRIRLAKDLLTDDGLIFISIDDNEILNLRKICTEIFGEDRFVAQITLLCNPKGRSQDKYIANCHEYVLVFSKSILPNGSVSIPKSMKEIEKDYSLFDSEGRPYRELELRNTHRDFGKNNRPKLWYPIYAFPNGSVSLEASPGCEEVYPRWDDGFEGCWTWGKDKAIAESHLLVSKKVSGKTKIYRKAYAYEDDNPPLKQVKSIWNDKLFFTEKGQMVFNALFNAKGKIFQSPKSIDMLHQCILMAQQKDIIVLDFFSGSGSTAHALLKANAEDGGTRKFILVQIPEKCEKTTEAAKAGYKTICEIGEERIRRAGKKIREESPQTTGDLDIGFRVFKVDSSNMKDVYYRPSEVDQGQMNIFADNIKGDRTPEDLLFQVMLDLGVLLSSKIEETVIAGKKVFSVANGYLIACFDKDVTDETVEAIAKKKPFYAVFRDAGIASDSVMTNFEQIFESYSPRTVRRVL